MCGAPEGVCGRDSGIYVDDILEAVPIDKYFELFKPKNGGDGGFIRVAMNFSTESPEEAAAGMPPFPTPPGPPHMHAQGFTTLLLRAP